MNNTIVEEMSKMIDNEIKSRIEAMNKGLIYTLKTELKKELVGVLPDNRIEDILYPSNIKSIRLKLIKNFSFELATSFGVHDESIFDLVEQVNVFKDTLKTVDETMDKINIINDLHVIKGA